MNNPARRFRVREFGAAPLALGLLLVVAGGCGGSTTPPAPAAVERAAEAPGATPLAISLRVINKSGRPDAEVEAVTRAAFADGARGTSRLRMRPTAGAIALLVSITVGEATSTPEGLLLAVLVAGDLEKGGCHVFEFDAKQTMEGGKSGVKADFDDLLRSAAGPAAKKLDIYASQIPASCKVGEAAAAK